MVPPTIRSNLAGLRRRERLLTFVWGLACWLAVVLILLLVCSFGDWLIDRWRDTPMFVRYAMLFFQVGVAAIAGFVFLVWPQLRRLPDETLALWVEAKLREFDHRLISAVQLNRPGAKLEGMSRELVGIVTEEAEQEARRTGFAQVADHRRLKWGAFVLLPILLLVALPIAIWPGLSLALLSRQALLPVEIPHSVYLENISPDVWPIGDSILLRYRVTGEYDKEMEGTVRAAPGGSFPLTFIEEDKDGAIFGAELPAASVDIYHSARLSDGRTRAPSLLKLAPRPVIGKTLAWVQLPDFCGKRPDGQRYERPQGLGDVVGIPGSRVRVQFEVENIRHKAWLIPLGPEKSDSKRSEEEGPLPEKEKPAIPMEIKGSFKSGKDDQGNDEEININVAEVVFDLTEGLTGYRLVIENEHGFKNQPPPRRSLRLIPEDAPQVALLRDTFGVGADFDLEGLPVVLGEQIRIPYICHGPYGLGRAQILYRLVPKHDSSSDKPVEEGPWIRLKLPEVNAGLKAGPFDPKTGVFMNTKFDQQVPFYAVPSLNPATTMGRTMGGGRYFLETNGLIDSKGNKLQLKSGDQVEYCIEVYATHREPEASIPFARSETRVSTVLDDKAFDTWLKGVGNEDERVRLLELRQKGVFEKK